MHFQPAPTDADPLPYVDEHDRVLGTLPRREVHLRGLRHRAVHVCVLDGAGRLWLQQRSRAKDAWGGHWDLSATGHVDAGESYDEAARRELREELGLTAAPRFLTKLEATAARGWEFHALYLLHHAGPLTDFNRAEIDALRAFSRAELEALLATPDSGLPLCPGVADALPFLEGNLK